MTIRTAVLLAAACVAALPADVFAQRGTGLSVEASAGMFTGGGGTFSERGGPALDLVLSVPVRREWAGSVVAGLTAGLNGPLGMDLDCPVGAWGECIPAFPTFASVAAVAGVQRQMAGGTVARVLAGPAFYHAVDGDAAAGLQARVDAARPILPHTSLVASVRGDMLPRYQGERLNFAAFGLGLRIH
jgi:hypothetical protein